MLNRISLFLVVAALLVTAAASAAADIVVNRNDDDSFASILSPPDGAVYVVGSCSATLTITATATTTLAYEACASYDIYGDHSDGEQWTGGPLRHSFELYFDGVTVGDDYTRMIPDAPKDENPESDSYGEYYEDWEPYSLSVEEDFLSITLEVGVGIHFVLVEHQVWDPVTTEIHASVNDFHFFYVVCVPEPATLTMVGAALLVGGVGLRRRRRTSARD